MFRNDPVVKVLRQAERNADLRERLQERLPDETVALIRRFGREPFISLLTGLSPDQKYHVLAFGLPFFAFEIRSELELHRLAPIAYAVGWQLRCIDRDAAGQTQLRLLGEKFGTLQLGGLVGSNDTRGPDISQPLACAAENDCRP